MAASSLPYTVGQWVSGDRFYGRQAELREILDGPRDGIWLLGMRRSGKTSLLKELERRTESLDRGYLPLFWDLQGATSLVGLSRDFDEAVREIESRLGRIGLDLEQVLGDDLFDSLNLLRRRLQEKGLTLLLLCDEAEELVRLQREDPSVLLKLRRALISRQGVRSVLASSNQLWELSEHKALTSPFLHGFTPPLYLQSMAPDEARSLLRQQHLAPEHRPPLAQQQVEEIRERCADLPFLLQILGRETSERGDLETAYRQVANEATVAYFFTVDYEALSANEQEVLEQLAAGGVTDPARAADPAVAEGLHRLAQLGFVRWPRGGDPRLASPFFHHWLQVRRGGEPAATAVAATSFRCAEWEVLPTLNLLRRGGDERRLEPQVMNLLVYLADNAGAVVSHDDIIDAVWQGRFVTNSVLTRSVSDLRKALGDDAGTPRFISTISKRGYRLIAPVVR